MNNEKVYMTIAEASKASGISQHKIRCLVKSGQIAHVMTGSKYLINYPKMMSFFETLEN